MNMAHDYTDEVEAILQMTQAALFVKSRAIDTLATELDQLRQENELLVHLASAKGGEQVPQLIKSLQQAQLESQQLTNRLQEEFELREDLERELEDTAAAAQELWESMQAVYSEAADSRAHSPSESPASDREEWGTPPGAVTPVSGGTAENVGQQQQAELSIAEAAAAALAIRAAAEATTGNGPISSSSTSTAAVTPAAPRVLSKEAVAAVEAAAADPSPAMHGILTPLENKLQSLSNKLVGLVSWLDARDSTSTPGSTPRRGATPASAAVTPTGSVSSSSRGRLTFITPLALDSCSPANKHSPRGLGSPIEGLSSPGSISSRRIGSNGSAMSSRMSPRMLRAAAAAAAITPKSARTAAAPAGRDDDVRVKDSSPAR